MHWVSLPTFFFYFFLTIHGCKWWETGKNSHVYLTCSVWFSVDQCDKCLMYRYTGFFQSRVSSDVFMQTGGQWWIAQRAIWLYFWCSDGWVEVEVGGSAIIEVFHRGSPLHIRCYFLTLPSSNEPRRRKRIHWHWRRRQYPQWTFNDTHWSDTHVSRSSVKNSYCTNPDQLTRSPHSSTRNISSEPVDPPLHFHNVI